jgi:ferredoxin
MATIYCFSSTGNSLYIANEIADKIGGNVLPMRDEPVVCEDDAIGLVFPVFFWGLPRMVGRFISKLKITNKDTYVFAVLTSGGPVFGVTGLLSKLMKSKNIRLHYGERIVSVTNYLPEYEPKDSEALHKKIDEQVNRIANAVKNRHEKRIIALSFLNEMLYKSYPAENCDRDFSIASSCISCASCQKICPAGNIVMEAGKPDFQHKCEHCLACLQNCPAHAIDWKNKTQGKQRYRNAKISLDDLIAFNSR